MKNNNTNISHSLGDLDRIISNFLACPAIPVSDLSPANTPDWCAFAIYLDNKPYHAGKSRETASYLHRVCLEGHSFLAHKITVQMTGKAVEYAKGRAAYRKILKANPEHAAAYENTLVLLRHATVRFVEVRDAGLLSITEALIQDYLRTFHISPH